MSKEICATVQAGAAGGFSNGSIPLMVVSPDTMDSFALTIRLKTLYVYH